VFIIILYTCIWECPGHSYIPGETDGLDVVQGYQPCNRRSQKAVHIYTSAQRTKKIIELKLLRSNVDLPSIEVAIISKYGNGRKCARTQYTSVQAIQQSVLTCL
jgi:hypothetical protein